jgi:hypothetical protein
MAIGVAVANAILLVTFAERSRMAGAASADSAVEGAQSRLRPILMTTLTLIAGRGVSQGDGGPAIDADLAGAAALAYDPAGNLYVSSATYVIRKIDLGGIITTIAGTGTWAVSGDGGAASAAAVGLVSALATDPAGNLFLAGGVSGNERVRRIDTGGTITTITGGLATPKGLAYGPDAHLYVSEYQGHTVRRIEGDGSKTTIAGTGNPGFSGDGGPASAAQLNQPHGLAFAPDRRPARRRRDEPPGAPHRRGHPAGRPHRGRRRTRRQRGARDLVAAHRHRRCARHRLHRHRGARRPAGHRARQPHRRTRHRAHPRSAVHRHRHRHHRRRHRPGQRADRGLDLHHHPGTRPGPHRRGRHRPGPALVRAPASPGGSAITGYTISEWPSGATWPVGLVTTTTLPVPADGGPTPSGWRR